MGIKKGFSFPSSFGFTGSAAKSDYASGGTVDMPEKKMAHGGAMKASKSYKKGGAAKSKKLRAMREEDANKMLREIAAAEASQGAPDQAVMQAMPPVRKQYPTDRREPMIQAAPAPGMGRMAGMAGMGGLGGMAKGGMRKRKA